MGRNEERLLDFWDSLSRKCLFWAIWSQTCVILHGKERITLRVTQRPVGLHRDLGLPDSRTVIFKKSVFISHPVCGNLL